MRKYNKVKFLKGLNCVMLAVKVTEIQRKVSVVLTDSQGSKRCQLGLNKGKNLKHAKEAMHCQVWCCIPILAALERLRPESHHKFEGSLGYIVTLSPKKEKNSNALFRGEIMCAEEEVRTICSEGTHLAEGLK